jgi:hypothetical protein
MSLFPKEHGVHGQIIFAIGTAFPAGRVGTWAPACDRGGGPFAWRANRRRSLSGHAGLDSSAICRGAHSNGLHARSSSELRPWILRCAGPSLSSIVPAVLLVMAMAHGGEKSCRRGRHCHCVLGRSSTGGVACSCVG